MKQTAEKNKKQRTFNHPISIWLVLKIAFAVAGFAMWGWSFVAVVVGIYLVWGIIKGILSCLFSLFLLALAITFFVAIIF